LNVKELEQLLKDIEVYMKLQEQQQKYGETSYYNQQCWNDILIIIRDKLD
jgi:hypothetical protein